MASNLNEEKTMSYSLKLTEKELDVLKKLTENVESVRTYASGRKEGTVYLDNIEGNETASFRAILGSLKKKEYYSNDGEQGVFGHLFMNKVELIYPELCLEEE